MNVVAFARAKQGTGASRRLRNSGRTPGIIYGGAAEPQLVEVDHNTLWYALKKEAFHASVLEMDLDGAKGQVLLRNVQYHPFKQLVLHVDFQHKAIGALGERSRANRIAGGIEFHVWQWLCAIILRPGKPVQHAKIVGLRESTSCESGERDDRGQQDAKRYNWTKTHVVSP